MTTSNDIANQALQMIGDNAPLVTGNSPAWDDSAAGVALRKIYTPCVQTVAKSFGWDFARNTISLTLSGQAAPFPWTFQYLYPANGIEIWTLIPSDADPLDPLPTNWALANTVIATVQQRVINTTVANAKAVFNNAPAENSWDVLFREAVVRLLASELAIALEGRPETAQSAFQTSGTFAQLGDSRNG